MPESPEVQIVVDFLNENLRGKKLINYYIQDRKWVKKGQQLDQIVSFTLQSVERKAKYLIFSFNKGDQTFYGINHLAMTGNWRIRNKLQSFPLHTRFSLNFENCVIDFIDTRKWGKWDLYDQEKFWSDSKIQSRLGSLGPEALGDKIHINYFNEKIEEYKKDKRKSLLEIKPLLMDQHFLSGIGNIYASEICFLSGIDPQKKFVDLTNENLQSLIESISVVMNKALDDGGSTIRDFKKPDGSKRVNQFNHMIYGRKFCRVCNGVIDRFLQNNRTSYRCLRCQNE